MRMPELRRRAVFFKNREKQKMQILQKADRFKNGNRQTGRIITQPVDRLFGLSRRRREVTSVARQVSPAGSVGASTCGRGLPRRPAPTAAIGARRGDRTRMRPIPRRRDDENQPLSIILFYVAQSRGIRRHAAAYPRLCTIAAVVSRATEVTSRLRRLITHYALRIPH